MLLISLCRMLLSLMLSCLPNMFMFQSVGVCNLILILVCQIILIEVDHVVYLCALPALLRLTCL